MPFFAIPFPMIDPVAVNLGPLPLRWYALAYIGGFVFGWLYNMFVETSFICAFCAGASLFGR